MLQIICTSKEDKFRGGVRFRPGRHVFAEDKFTPAQIKEFKSDRDFQIDELVEGELSTTLAIDRMSLEETIAAAVEILTPAAEDYGIDIKALGSDITVIFAEAQGLAPKDIPGENELEVLVAACTTLIEQNPRDEDKFAGKVPKTKALADIVGWKVTGQERDRALGLLDK